MTIASDAAVAERASYLRGFGLWAALSDPVLHATAAALQPARYAAGDFIIRQGEPGRHLHVLTRGEAVVRVHASNGATITVATMTEGACFGEMSLMSGDLTSADVVAQTECETLALDRPAFEALVAAEPQLLREFVRMVSRRLWDSNVAMGAAREKEQGLTRFLQEANGRSDGELVGKLPATRAVQRQIEALARLDGPVLIQGERGTGKELAARLIHFGGARRDAPLLCTDCAQIAETPWGDKLFGGYRPAAGEQPAAVSYLDLARGGTIVLKNVDALPRALQERLAELLGAEAGRSREDPEAPRVLATCRTDIGQLAATGKVSAALAAALGGHTLALAPLRHRKRDIPELAAHFVAMHARRLGRPVPSLADEAIGKLVTHDYRHGNVGELEDAIRRAVILTDGERIEAEALFLGQPSAASRWALNLLRLSRPDVRRALPLGLRAARVLVGAVFAFVLYECLFGSLRANENWGIILAWSVGWPLLIASLFVAGRACCAVCPIPAVARLAQRVLHLGWRIPSWVKRHDVTLAMTGFVAIVWAEEMTAMRQSPRATAVLLLSIAAGAIVTAVLLPRRAWCRHLCPMGGFASVGAMTGLLELRPTADICGARCRDHACFKGASHAEGCPLFNHVMFLDSNQHCVLCLECVDSCPNESPQLNLRLPAADLVSRADASGPGRWTAMLSGLLVALAVLHEWARRGGPAGGAAARFAAITLVLALGAVVMPAALHLVARRLQPRSGAAALWQAVTAWLPVVIAGFLGYQLGLVPAFEGVRLAIGRSLGSGAPGAFSLPLLAVVQAAVLAAGLLVALGVWWNLPGPGADGEDGGEDRRRSGLSAGALAGGMAYWALLVLLLVV